MDLELDENQRAIADLALQILRESLTRGIPRPKSAIRSRCTSFVPPPKVRKSVP